MEISKISIVKSIDPEKALQGVASVELNNAIRINDIRIIKAGNSYMISMPSKRLEGGEVAEWCYPLNDAKDKLQKEIIKVFKSDDEEKYYKSSNEAKFTSLKIRKAEKNDENIKAVGQVIFNNDFLINLSIAKNGRVDSLVFPSRISRGRRVINFIELIDDVSKERLLNKVFTKYRSL